MMADFQTCNGIQLLLIICSDSDVRLQNDMQQLTDTIRDHAALWVKK